MSKIFQNFYQSMKHWKNTDIGVIISSNYIHKIIKIIILIDNVRWFQHCSLLIQNCVKIFSKIYSNMSSKVLSKFPKAENIDWESGAPMNAFRVEETMHQFVQFLKP